MNPDRFQYLLQASAALSKHRIAETDLPWRKYRTPYRIFLAEMLLIRTRADVVAKHFERITAQYPTVAALAQADISELRDTLRPLGLSKRVPYLLKAAKYIYEKYEGNIPQNLEDLLSIPGVGKYTATAILAFAFDQRLIPTDVNILRFISRFTGLPMKHATKESKEISEFLLLLSEKSVEISSEDLLDFTRLICKARYPRCSCCLVNVYCLYYKTKVLHRETHEESN